MDDIADRRAASPDMIRVLDEISRAVIGSQGHILCASWDAVAEEIQKQCWYTAVVLLLRLELLSDPLGAVAEEVRVLFNPPVLNRGLMQWITQCAILISSTHDAAYAWSQLYAAFQVVLCADDYELLRYSIGREYAQSVWDHAFGPNNDGAWLRSE